MYSYYPEDGSVQLVVPVITCVRTPVCLPLCTILLPTVSALVYPCTQTPFLAPVCALAYPCECLSCVCEPPIASLPQCVCVCACARACVVCACLCVCVCVCVCVCGVCACACVCVCVCVCDAITQGRTPPISSHGSCKPIDEYPYCTEGAMRLGR